MDWWDRFELGDVEIVMTPARHASGRHLFDGNRTLWAGYAFVGDEHRVFFSGDTGMFPGIKEIGDRFGPFDVTMIEVGTYAQSWADWHMGPEQALEAHTILGGEVFLPIHWGLFNLSTHGWTEPIERVVAGAREAGVAALTLRPGESFEPGQPIGGSKWWPDLPWRSAAEYPVISTQLGGD
jgi:L-ascorbate metabolism protein UlaG (beta-lactamase superfamily)